MKNNNNNNNLNKKIFFKKIYIEITNICNLTCDFCPPTSRKLEFMSLDSFKYILNKIKPYTNYLYLHVKGEPLIHKNLDDMLKLCTSMGFKVCITTNGTLINKNLNILLNNKCVHKVHISLHSYEASTVNGLLLEDYILNIAELIKKAEFLIVLRLWNEGGLDKFNTKIINLLKNNFEFIRDDKINKNTYIENSNKFEWGNINNNNNNINNSMTGFCYGLRDQIGILVNGDVIPCCLDNNGDIKLGNIFEKELVEIYNSERALNIYNGFSNRKRIEKLCQTCGFINRFNK